MAVKIRLMRMGAKKRPFYRVVIADSRSPRDGRFIENIGTYDSTKQPAVVDIDAQKAMEWMQKGAQPTDTVRSLFSEVGIMKQYDELKNGKKEA
ncbi:MAG: 30S ribosomal protein S16 [Bacillota bacterium]|nr:30S ribosomal protein S16 [Bacillota bacterium]HWR56990.1 30S ribosomal protein S16 [Negativicutes bacterium]